mmetsp:Transcript_759/g.2731  ORF Transcript_759/g.2731 Transcript_759/m.2731 type:complete len:463 (-) Transcript_759:416-1804(-)
MRSHAELCATVGEVTAVACDHCHEDSSRGSRRNSELNWISVVVRLIPCASREEGESLNGHICSSAKVCQVNSETGHPFVVISSAAVVNCHCEVAYACLGLQEGEQTLDWSQPMSNPSLERRNPSADLLPTQWRVLITTDQHLQCSVPDWAALVSVAVATQLCLEIGSGIGLQFFVRRHCYGDIDRTVHVRLVKHCHHCSSVCLGDIEHVVDVVVILQRPGCKLPRGIHHAAYLLDGARAVNQEVRAVCKRILKLQGDGQAGDGAVGHAHAVLVGDHACGNGGVKRTCGAAHVEQRLARVRVDHYAECARPLCIADLLLKAAAVSCPRHQRNAVRHVHSRRQRAGGVGAGAAVGEPPDGVEVLVAEQRSHALQPRPAPVQPLERVVLVVPAGGVSCEGLGDSSGPGVEELWDEGVLKQGDRRGDDVNTVVPVVNFTLREPQLCHGSLESSVHVLGSDERVSLV